MAGGQYREVRQSPQGPRMKRGCYLELVEHTSVRNCPDHERQTERRKEEVDAAPLWDKHDRGNTLLLYPATLECWVSVLGLHCPESKQVGQPLLVRRKHGHQSQAEHLERKALEERKIDSTPVSFVDQHMKSLVLDAGTLGRLRTA